MKESMTFKQNILARDDMLKLKMATRPEEN